MKLSHTVWERSVVKRKLVLFCQLVAIREVNVRDVERKDSQHVER